MKILFQKIFISTVIFLSLFSSSFVLVFAQGDGVSGGAGYDVTKPPGYDVSKPSTGSTAKGSSENIEFKNPFTFSTVQQFTDKLLDIVIKVGGIIAFFFIIYSGFLFVTAAGDETKIKSAKATFLWTIVGVAIVLGAKVISTLLQTTVSQVVQVK